MIDDKPTTVAVLAILLDRSPPAQLWVCVVRGEVDDKTRELQATDGDSIWIRVAYIPKTLELIEFPTQFAVPFFRRTSADIVDDWYTKTGERRSHYTLPWVQAMGNSNKLKKKKTKSKNQAAESDADASTPTSTPGPSRRKTMSSTKRTPSPQAGDGIN